jgi:hypothetical protein
MQQRQAGDHIHQLVQGLPAPGAHRLHRAIEGSGRQRRKQHETAEPHQDERPLGDVLGNVGDVEAHVEPAVAQKVQQHIEIDEQPQHAAEPGQCRRAGDHPQRRHGQRDAQEAQCPVAGGANEVFSRIGAELVGGGAVEQPRERQQREQEQDRLGRRVHQQRPQRAAPCRAGRHQKFFFRSMPAYSWPTCCS